MTTTISPSLGHAPLLTQDGTGASPGYDAIDFRRLVPPDVQEGVVGTSSFMATQRGAGVNMSVDIAANSSDGLPTAAYVAGDSVSFQGLYAVTAHTAVINEVISAAHATLPRIDMIVLEVLDNVHDASGSNLARTRVVNGTATSGATLDNRTGAAALPSSCLLLTDVLVAGGATSITNAVIRDRRKWARGAYCHIVRNANAAAGNDYSTTSTNLTLIDGTNIAPRIECSGVPVRVRLIGTLLCVGTALVSYFAPQVDSTGVNGMPNAGASVIGGTALGEAFEASGGGFGNRIWAAEWYFTPSAGSHIIAPAWGTSNSTIQMRARSDQPLVWIVEEILRQNTRNNSVTTG